MLGNVISEGQGKRTGRRVVAVSPTFKVEVSFEEATKVLGTDGMNIGTYDSSPKPDGSLEGIGQGVWASLEGDMVTWNGIGIGRLGAGGTITYRGCLSFSTSSPKFTSLNGVAGVFEFDVDAQGNTKSKIWEWK